MIKQIKNYLKKYHEANLWLAEREVLEQKKQFIQTATVLEQTDSVYEAVEQHQQVVYTHHDVGHNQAETSRIQEIYSELENFFGQGRLAI